MKQSRLANLVVMILFVLNSFAIQPLPVNAEGIVPTLTTDKSDYRPEETVQVTGSGFTPGSEVQLPVIRPDGSIIHWVDSSQTFEPGWDTVTTDEYGYLTYSYYLDGVTGQYEIRAYPADWVLGEDQSGLSETPVATVTFTDAAALTLTKSASPLTYTAAGQVINFSYLLQNTGTTMLNGPFTVTDNKVPSVSCPATATLASGASITCTGTYTISSVDAALGYTVNTATASSSNPGATTSNTTVRIV